MLRRVSLSRKVLALTPAALRPVLISHREVVKFLVTGGVCFVITVAVNYLLKLTVLHNRPVTALTIATVVSVIASYIMNRQWSFRTRGGRRTHHEAFLFFLISGIGVGINDLPLYLSRYALDLREPYVGGAYQEIADFLSGIIIGTALAMVFRLWAFKRFVFPHENARPRRAEPREPAGTK